MKTFLFDFDGTLVDSMPTYSAIMLHILDEHHVPYSHDIMKLITPLGFSGTAKMFINMGVSMSESSLVALMQTRAIYEYAHHILPKDTVISSLTQLKAQGANLNILTASPHITLDPCLKRLGIFNIFSNVWSCDDFHTTKSDPSIYKQAAERLGVPVGDILFVDDNYNAGRIAKSVGMKVCGIYDESSKEYIQDIKNVADYYIYKFSELLALPYVVN